MVVPIPDVLLTVLRHWYWDESPTANYCRLVAAIHHGVWQNQRATLPAPAPEPEPASTPEPQPEPEPEQTPDDVAAAIDAAVAGLQAADTPPAPGGQGTAPSGPPLNDGELAGLRRTVESCWNKSTVSSDGLRSRVVLRATLAANASVISIELIESDAPSAAASESAFAAASRALRRCLPQAGLPAEKYETWKEIEFEFDYSADRVR